MICFLGILLDRKTWAARMSQEGLGGARRSQNAGKEFKIKESWSLGG
jgi:hypothetical protein